MPPVNYFVWNRPKVVADPIQIDANVLLGYLVSSDRLHARAIDFLTYHLAAKKRIQVSLLAIDEAMFQLSRHQVATSRGVSYGAINLGQELKRNPLLLKPFVPNIRQAITTALGWLTLVGCGPATPQQVLDSWLDRLNDISGMHDALHLALAEHNGAKTFVTGDKDYRVVRSLPYTIQIAKL